MKRSLPLLTEAVLDACASSAPIRWAPPTDFNLAVADNPAQQRFDLN